MKNVLLLFFFIPVFVSAQQNQPLHTVQHIYEIYRKTDSSFICGTGIVAQDINRPHFFKPFIVKPTEPERTKSKSFSSILYRKVKRESLLIIQDTSSKFSLTIDPLLNLELGKDQADTSGEKLYKNTRGFLLRGHIGKKFAFESSFYENQATFANYIDQYIAGTDNLFPSKANYDYNVIPGQGRAKKFKANGYDYAMASGYVSYSPVEALNIQVGHGKHFVGDGYRSLLLSDNAFNYPYARITTTIGKFQYTNLYTSFMNLTNGGNKIPPGIERLFQKKVGSFQTLSVNLFRRLSLGLFQCMIWEAADSTNRQHVNFNTFDPVIGINALNYGLHNKNNVLLGFLFKLKISKSISLYGQYVLDDLKGKATMAQVRNKNGYQVGFYYFNIFTIRNLILQTEYNSVRPYTYASANPEQSYTHYNQALAHPLGANLNEAIVKLNYRVKDFFTEIKLNYIVKGKDSLFTNFGGNIFKSDTFVSTPVGQQINTTQGVVSTILYQDIQVGYLVNPATSLNIVVGLSNRTEKAEDKTAHTQFVYVGIRTSLSNFYYDF
ncbi:MAG TPA: hypothetical protein VFF27_06485 [Bacteroidia bacterium]|jgi:hypothetical protein|nr:hypothetical protein [Bacteroidia bacterium]